MQAAEVLLETTDLTVEVIAHQVGLGSADTLRHHLSTRRGVNPAAYRRTLQGPRSP